MGEMIEAFRQDLVSRITGFTGRQLRRLERLGIVAPSVAPREEGWPPLYSFKDLLRLRVASEMLKRDFNAPQIRRLIDDLEADGFEDPLVSIQFYGDEPKGELRPGRRSKRLGRTYYVDPASPGTRSARNREQTAETFDLDVKDLRANLVGTIEELTMREHGSVERVRGVQAYAPVIVGTRIPADLIGRLAEAGWTRDRIRESYPQLTNEDIDAALKHERIPEDAVA
jgi:uncharacterized protein (DUF433 family)